MEGGLSHAAATHALYVVDAQTMCGEAQPGVHAPVHAAQYDPLVGALPRSLHFFCYLTV